MEKYFSRKLFIHEKFFYIFLVLNLLHVAFLCLKGIFNCFSFKFSSFFKTSTISYILYGFIKIINWEWKENLNYVKNSPLFCGLKKLSKCCIGKAFIKWKKGAKQSHKVKLNFNKICTRESMDKKKKKLLNKLSR